jgi:neutral ceramidase
MAGRRLREAVKETLISNSDGEFNNETHVVIAGLTNTYSQYIATFEEYYQQRYEVRRNRKGFQVTIKYLNLLEIHFDRRASKIYPYYC